MSYIADLTLANEHIYIAFNDTDINHNGHDFLCSYAVDMPIFTYKNLPLHNNVTCNIRFTDGISNDILGAKITFYKKISNAWQICFAGMVTKLEYKDNNFVNIFIEHFSTAFYKLRDDNFSPVCPLIWGSNECGVNRELFKKQITINSVDNLGNFTFSFVTPWNLEMPTNPYLIFNNKKIPLLSLSIGRQKGRFLEDYLTIGDTAFLYAGCDGELSTCRKCFDNAINFGGFDL